MTFRVGDRFILRARTKKAKKFLLRHDALWTVLRIRMRVPFSTMMGPWLLLDDGQGPTSPRWVHSSRDKVFKTPCSPASGGYHED